MPTTSLNVCFGGKAAFIGPDVRVRFGLSADIPTHSDDVRFTPESGHWPMTSAYPLSAKSGQWA